MLANFCQDPLLIKQINSTAIWEKKKNASHFLHISFEIIECPVAVKELAYNFFKVQERKTQFHSVFCTQAVGAHALATRLCSSCPPPQSSACCWRSYWHWVCSFLCDFLLPIESEFCPSSMMHRSADPTWQKSMLVTAKLPSWRGTAGVCRQSTSLLLIRWFLSEVFGCFFRWSSFIWH